MRQEGETRSSGGSCDARVDVATLAINKREKKHGQLTVLVLFYRSDRLETVSSQARAVRPLFPLSGQLPPRGAKRAPRAIKPLTAEWKRNNRGPPNNCLTRRFRDTRRTGTK